jgi:hypothetical protein
MTQHTKNKSRNLKWVYLFGNLAVWYLSLTLVFASPSIEVGFKTNQIFSGVVAGVIFSFFWLFYVKIMFSYLINPTGYPSFEELLSPHTFIGIIISSIIFMIIFFLRHDRQLKFNLLKYNLLTSGFTLLLVILFGQFTLSRFPEAYFYQFNINLLIIFLFMEFLIFFLWEIKNIKEKWLSS